MAHGAGVGMDEQHTKRGATEDIDHLAVTQRQVLEPQESGDAHRHGKQLVGVLHKVVPVGKQRTGHGQQDGGDGGPAPHPSALEYRGGVQPNVRGYQIDDAEPRDVVEADHEARDAAQQCVYAEEQPQQEGVLPLGHVMDEDVPKRNCQPEAQEATGEVVIESPYGHQDLHHLRHGEGLVACRQQYHVQRQLISVNPGQQLDQFPPRDLTLAHEVAGNHEEAVDTRLAPHAE